MKKLYFLLCLCALGFASKGQQLLYEPFNYTPDAALGLTTQSAGAWTPVNTGDSILVVSGSLSYAGLQSSTGNRVKFDADGTDYYASYASQTAGSVYSSFIVNVTSLGGLTTAGGYFASVLQSGSTSAFGAAVWTRLSTTAGKFNVGISTRSNSAVTWLANDLDINTSYFIVTAYDMVTGAANDVARIWLNPTSLGGAEPAAAATSVPGTDLSSAARFLLRQANAAGTPFIEFDELRVGTTWASVTPAGSSSSPTLSAGSLPSFGNVCSNTVAGPNTFTITGTNLSTADVTVGALAGYTFSTTSGGTYTNSLTLTQPGGSYSQAIFVKFSPTAVQSYNGNISVSGGGATAINVAATGSGTNDMPTVTTGSASSITANSATAAGNISAVGCSSVTAYGIEYSTTSGFANGSGTAVTSSNLAGGNFSSNLSGLASGTTYYYHAYATNSGGTGYGAQQSFTTVSTSPALSATSLTAFGNVCTGSSGGPNSFTVTGTNLSNADITVGPLAGYTFSTTAGGTYTNSLTLTQAGGSYSQQVFVKLSPTAIQSYNGNIPVSGGGAPAQNVAASGAGVNTMATVATGAASAITSSGATAAGSISSNGCSNVTAYGIEYSTTSGFANGSGTQLPSSNLASGTFSSNMTGLSQSTVYYYHAYATNGAGTAYGTQQTFTTLACTPPTVTTMVASNVQSDRATLGGTIGDNGCTPVVTYGVEYSGINGFLGGSGTRVYASNSNNGNFSATALGLVAGTNYYYRAFATNAGTTGYGAQQQFTTDSLVSGLIVTSIPATRGQQITVSMTNLHSGFHSIRLLNSLGQLVYHKDMNIQGSYINTTMTVPVNIAIGVYRLQVITNTDVLITRSILIAQ